MSHDSFLDTGKKKFYDKKENFLNILNFWALKY